MPAFIILCLVAVACADQLGYNYQPGLSSVPGASNGVPSYDIQDSTSPSYGPQGSNGPSYGPKGSNGPSYGPQGSNGPAYGPQGSNGPSYGDQGSNGPSFVGPGSIGFGSPSYDAHGSNGSPSFGSQVVGGPSNQAPGSNGSPSFGSQGVGGPSNEAQGSDGSPSNAAEGELEKEFYIFSANDEDFHDPAVSKQVANSVKQGLRVVFIKGPDNRALEEAAFSLAKNAADQKTDIYVLNKQTDLSNLVNRLNNENKNSNNKPEVHFVKYRTPEDAANAQKAIQSQYDALGGPSQHIDGGVAPSLNFASHAAPVRAPSAPAPRNNYLPASIFRY